MLTLDHNYNDFSGTKRIMRMVFSGFFRKNDGSALIEFAIVAPVFLLILFGVTEFGLFMYHKITVERIAVEVSRIASIAKTADSGACSGTANQSEYITCIVREKSHALINGDRVQVQIGRVADGGTSLPDICLDDPVNPSSAPATCTVYEDVDGNGIYRGAAASNYGGNGDTIEVRISYPWSVQFPLLKNYFGSASNKGITMITASTTIKNEP